jgi:hypothetical protein
MGEEAEFKQERAISSIRSHQSEVAILPASIALFIQHSIVSFGQPSTIDLLLQSVF